MGGTGEKARNMNVSGRHSKNLQNFMLFTITYADFMKNFSFAFSIGALTTPKQDDTINLI